MLHFYLHIIFKVRIFAPQFRNKLHPTYVNHITYIILYFYSINRIIPFSNQGENTNEEQVQRIEHCTSSSKLRKARGIKPEAHEQSLNKAN